MSAKDSWGKKRERGSIRGSKDTVTDPRPLFTLASSGLNYPTGVAVDAAGNVYFASSGTGTSALTELARAYVPGQAISEGSAAGMAALLPVLPSTQSLTGLFAPKATSRG
jgi:hypothetical protein